jgi:hypothetical protein
VISPSPANGNSTPGADLIANLIAKQKSPETKQRYTSRDEKHTLRHNKISMPSVF